MQEKWLAAYITRSSVEEMNYIPQPQPMKLEHLYNVPAGKNALRLSSMRMRICRALAQPLDKTRCIKIIKDIEEHLALWRMEVNKMRHRSTALNHKKHALFAWNLEEDKIVGSTCPHFDTLCFQYVLALLNIEMGSFEKAMEESKKCKELFATWAEPELADASLHCLLFPDFHEAVSAYAEAQLIIDRLDRELSSFPNVVFADCVKTSLDALQMLDKSRALNLRWNLNLQNSMAGIASLCRGLMALDTIQYEHDGKLQLSRGAKWKESEFPVALSILNLANDSKSQILLSSVRRVVDSDIRGFLEGINRDVYHTKPHPNFQKVFEETILVKYTVKPANRQATCCLKG